MKEELDARTSGTRGSGAGQGVVAWEGTGAGRGEVAGQEQGGGR